VEGIVVGTCLEIRTEQLQIGKTKDVGNDDDESDAANHIFPIFKYVFVAHRESQYVLKLSVLLSFCWVKGFVQKPQ